MTVQKYMNSLIYTVLFQLKILQEHGVHQAIGILSVTDYHQSACVLLPSVLSTRDVVMSGLKPLSFPQQQPSKRHKHTVFFNGNMLQRKQCVPRSTALT